MHAASGTAGNGMQIGGLSSLQMRFSLFVILMSGGLSDANRTSRAHLQNIFPASRWLVLARFCLSTLAVANWLVE